MMTPKTNVTVEKILDIIEEVLRKRWPKIFEDQASVLTDRAIMVASRWVNRDSSRGYKHSYHVVYPRILFEGNKGEMKELAEEIAQHPGVRAAGKKGEVMSAVDTAVYIKEGLFRCVESCKMTTRLVQDWGVLTLYKKSHVPPTMQASPHSGLK